MGNVLMSGRVVIGLLTLLTVCASSQAHAQHYAYDGRHPSGQYQGYTPQTIPGGYTPRGVDFDAIPDDTGWLYEDTPLEQGLKNIFRHSFFRVEYLLWDISDPGNNVLGEPTGDGSDPREVQNVTDPNTGAAVDLFSLSTDNIRINENNGIRGVYGLPLATGTFEMNVWALRSSNDRQFGDDYVAQVGSYLLTDGVPQGGLIVYDNNYQADLKTGVWGTEGNFIWEGSNPQEQFNFRPLAGFRYVSFDEALNQSGYYDDVNSSGATVETYRKIDQSVKNNLYGPQFGMRAELASERFTIGVEPKIMLGANTLKSSLRTQSVLTATDPSQYLTDTETTFGPVAEVNAFAQVRFTPYLSLYASYSFMWLGGLSRPAGNTVYNSSSVTDTSIFSQEIEYTDAILQGLTVGGQIQY